MKTFFQDTFQYTHHSNQSVISAVQDNPSLFTGRAGVLICHSLNAHHIWNHRISGSSPSFSVWGALALNQLQEVETENFSQSLQIIEKEDFDEKISYQNTKGDTFVNSVSEILFHIINHSTYHRGQIVNLLKQEGVPPLVIDYIFYKR
jgi:uncharacterized damage-inducible protein DinB